MDGRRLTTIEDYRRMAPLFAGFLSDSTNLQANGWDQASSQAMYLYITTVVLPVANAIISLLEQVDAGNAGPAVKNELRDKKVEFDHCVREMYVALDHSQKPDAVRYEAYQGLGLIALDPDKPRGHSQATTETEFVSAKYLDYALHLVTIELGENTTTHKHRLPPLQDHRKVEYGYVKNDVVVYTNERFDHYFGTNRRKNTQQVPAEMCTGEYKLILRTRIVSKNREEGPAGPVYELPIPAWNATPEQLKAAAESAARIAAEHLAAARAAKAAGNGNAGDNDDAK